MSFEKEGFLSPTSSRWKSDIRAKCPQWFAFAEKVNIVGNELLRKSKPSREDETQLVASLLFARALQSFQASIILSELGMETEARTLVRNCAESAIALGKLAVDDTFIDVLISDYDKHRKTIANALLNDNDVKTHGNMSQEHVEQLKSLVNEITEKYAPGEPKEIKWAHVAEAKGVGMNALFNTIFRCSSSDLI